MFRTVHTRSIRAEISAIRFRSSFFSRRLSITLARRRRRRKSAFRRPAHGGHYPTRACTVRSVFRSRKHVRHVCHGRRGPGRPGTHAEPAPLPMRRRIRLVSGYARVDSSPRTGVGRRKRRARTDSTRSPPRLTAPRSRRHHRAGPLRRQARQGCKGPPLGRRRRRDGARNHEREAEAQVREEEHHCQARRGGRRRLLHRQSGTSSKHLDARNDRPRPSLLSKTNRVGSVVARSRRDGTHAGVFCGDDRRAASTRETHQWRVLVVIISRVVFFRAAPLRFFGRP